MGQKSSVGTSGAGKGLNRNPVVTGAGKAAAFLSNHLQAYLGTKEELEPHQAHEQAKRLAAAFAGYGLTLKSKDGIIVQGDKKADLKRVSSDGIENPIEMFRSLGKQNVEIYSELKGHKITTENAFNAYIAGIAAKAEKEYKPKSAIMRQGEGEEKTADTGALEGLVSPEEGATDLTDTSLSKIAFQNIAGLKMTKSQILSAIKQLRKDLGFSDVYTPDSRKEGLSKIFQGQPIMEFLYTLVNTGKDANVGGSLYSSGYNQIMVNENPGMTLTEASAAVLYTTSQYGAVNNWSREIMSALFEYLRAKEPQQKAKYLAKIRGRLIGSDADTFRRQLQLIYEATGISQKRNWVLTRGADIPQDIRDEIQEHGVFWDSGLSSTAIKPNEQGWSSKPDQLVFVSDVGINAVVASTHQGEDEVIIPPGFMWYVHAKMPNMPVFQSGSKRNAYLMSAYDSRTGKPKLQGIFSTEKDQNNYMNANLKNPPKPKSQEQLAQEKDFEKSIMNDFMVWDAEIGKWVPSDIDASHEARQSARKIQLEPLKRYDDSSKTAKQKQSRLEELVKSLPAHAQKEAYENGPLGGLLVAPVLSKFIRAGQLPVLSGGEINLSGTSSLQVQKAGKSALLSVMAASGKFPAHTMAGAVAGLLYAKLTKSPAAVALLHDAQGSGGYSVGQIMHPGAIVIGDVQSGLGKLSNEEQKAFARKFVSGFLLDVLLGNRYALGKDGEKVQIVKTVDGEYLPLRIKNVGSLKFQKSGPVKPQIEVEESLPEFAGFQQQNAAYQKMIALAGYTPDEFKQVAQKQYEQLTKFRAHIGGFDKLVDKSALPSSLVSAMEQATGDQKMLVSDIGNILEKRYQLLKGYIDKM